MPEYEVEIRADRVEGKYERDLFERIIFPLGVVSYGIVIFFGQLNIGYEIHIAAIMPSICFAFALFFTWMSIHKATLKSMELKRGIR